MWKTTSLAIFPQSFLVLVFHLIYFSRPSLLPSALSSSLRVLYSISKPPAIAFALQVIHNLFLIWILHAATLHSSSSILPPSVSSLQHFLLAFTPTVCPDFSSPGFLIYHPSALCLCHHCQMVSHPPLLSLSLFIGILSLTISWVLLLIT